MFSLAELKNKLIELQKKFNAAQCNIPDLSVYEKQFKDQMTEKHREKINKEYLPKFEDLKDSIISVLNVAKKEKNKILFPLKFSSDALGKDQMLGEQKSLNAKLFFGQFRDQKEIILHELANSFELKEYDYLNSLLDIYLISYKNEKNDVDIQHEEILKFRDAMYQELKVTEALAEVQELTILRDTTIYFIKNISENGIVYLIAPIEFDQMGDDYFTTRQMIVDKFGEVMFNQIQNASLVFKYGESVSVSGQY